MSSTDWPPGSERCSTAITRLQAYLHVLVDRPGSELQLPAEMMRRARTVWLASARKVRIPSCTEMCPGC